MSDFLCSKESYAILGACFNVYNEKGCGFLEAVYQECLEIEFEYLSIPFEAQKPLEIIHRGRVLKKRFEPDFICYGKIILEIKASSHLVDENRSQLLNSLNASGFELGLLANFGHHPRLEYERFRR